VSALVEAAPEGVVGSGSSGLYPGTLRPRGKPALGVAGWAGGARPRARALAGGGRAAGGRRSGDAPLLAAGGEGRPAHARAPAAARPRGSGRGGRPSWLTRRSFLRMVGEAAADGTVDFVLTVPHRSGHRSRANATPTHGGRPSDSHAAGSGWNRSTRALRLSSGCRWTSGSKSSGGGSEHGRAPGSTRTEAAIHRAPWVGGPGSSGRRAYRAGRAAALDDSATARAPRLGVPTGR
jgi:hypothetical protein